MRAIKYLIQNTNPLNLLLLAIIIVIAIGVIFPLTRMNAGYVLPQVKTKIIEQEEKPEEKSNSILPSDYAMIGETNLFHPERRIPIDKKADEIPKPELVLYGTMVQGGVQLAFIEDKKNPKTTPGRGNRQTVIKKGETIGGFVVSEIGTDRITLMKGDEKMTVLLANGGEKRKEQAGSQRPMQTTAPGHTSNYFRSRQPFWPCFHYHDAGSAARGAAIRGLSDRPVAGCGASAFTAGCIAGTGRSISTAGAKKIKPSCPYFLEGHCAEWW